MLYLLDNCFVYSLFLDTDLKPIIKVEIKEEYEENSFFDAGIVLLYIGSIISLYYLLGWKEWLAIVVYFILINIMVCSEYYLTSSSLMVGHKFCDHEILLPTIKVE